MNSNNFGGYPNPHANQSFQISYSQSVQQPTIIPNPNGNRVRFPPNFVPFSQFVLENATPVNREQVSNQGSFAVSRSVRELHQLLAFKPQQSVSAKDLTLYIRSTLKSAHAARALNFTQVRRVDADTELHRVMNEEICCATSFGVYSESPFLRPVVALRAAHFACPTVASTHMADHEGMVRQLRDRADAKVATTSALNHLTASRPSALNIGFPTDCLLHIFSFELDNNLIAYLTEQSRSGGRNAREQFRVVLRFGWATSNLICHSAPVNGAGPLRLLTQENLPRCLTIRVCRRPIPLPEPIFHAGQAVKLGHRLRNGVDITDRIPLRPGTNNQRSRTVEVEMVWVNAPLEDHGEPLLQCFHDEVLTPNLACVLSLPLVQVTLDRVEPIPRLMKLFTDAVAGQPTGEAQTRVQRPDAPPVCVGGGIVPMLPIFTPEKLLGLYDFCVAEERVIPEETTLAMLKRKTTSDEDLLCEDWIPVNLDCPVTLTRIQVPVRSVNCDHLQCFDLATYLGINHKRPRWRCPVCSLPARFCDLRRDDFFAKLLREPSLREAHHIKVNGEGKFSFVTDSVPSADGGGGGGGGGGDEGAAEAEGSAATNVDTTISPVKVEQPGLPDSSGNRPAVAAAPCIMILDDSDDEEEGNGGRDAMAAVAAPPAAPPTSLPPIQGLSQSFKPLHQSARPAFDQPQQQQQHGPPRPPVVNEVVDLTELSDSDDDDDDGSRNHPPPLPPPPTLSAPSSSSRGFESPLCSLLVVPTQSQATPAQSISSSSSVSGGAGGGNSKVLVISSPPTNTPLHNVLDNQGPSATLAAGGTASAVASTSSSSSMNSTVASSTTPAPPLPVLPTFQAPISAAATLGQVNSPSKRPLEGPTGFSSSSSSTGRSGFRFKVTAKKRCVDTSSISSTQHLFLTSESEESTSSTTVATSRSSAVTVTVTTSSTSLRLRSSTRSQASAAATVAAAAPVPSSAPTRPSKRVLRGRASRSLGGGSGGARRRRRVFLDDRDTSDVGTPVDSPAAVSITATTDEEGSRLGTGTSERASNYSEEDDEEEEEAEENDDDDDDEWTPSPVSPANHSKRKSSSSTNAANTTTAAAMLAAAAKGAQRNNRHNQSSESGGNKK